MKHLILISLLVVGIAGCNRYKPVIQQGNALDSTTIAQLKVGMSKADAIQALGSPLLTDDFNQDRWDYLYYVVENGQRSEQKNLTLLFDGDIISKIN
jgi:outer membrane protein assembly factor BamE